jgi:hypothetical protein
MIRDEYRGIVQAYGTMVLLTSGVKGTASGPNDKDFQMCFVRDTLECLLTDMLSDEPDSQLAPAPFAPAKGVLP